jgi:hypothetical protein
LLLPAVALALPADAQARPRTIHVFVALADNNLLVSDW